MRSSVTSGINYNLISKELHMTNYNGITKEAAAEITNLMRTIVCNDTLCDYLLSDSFKEKLDPTDKSIYWKLRYEWADAIVRLDDKFGIQHPSLEYVLEKIDYLEDQKFMERQENECWTNYNKAEMSRSHGGLITAFGSTS